MKLNPCPKCGHAKYEEIQVGKPGFHKYHGKLYAVSCKCVRTIITAKKSEVVALWNKP